MVGRNNQGKTNFLEAIYVGFHGKSFREKKRSPLIAFDASQATIGIEGSVDETPFRAYFRMTREEEIQFYLNSQPVKSFKSISDAVRVSYFSSDVIRLFQDSPDVRRQVIDQCCIQTVSGASTLLMRFSRAMSQKNRLLKDDCPDEQLSVWNETISDLGAQVIQLRRSIFSKIQETLQPIVFSVFPNLKDLHLVYRPNGILEVNAPLETLKQNLMDRMTECAEKERVLGHGVVGPHRDDFEILIGDQMLFHHFSRGINRSMAYLFKLSVMDLVVRLRGGTPFLLLDDVFAEIDSENKRLLLNVSFPNRAGIYASVDSCDRCHFESTFVMQEGELVRG